MARVAREGAYCGINGPQKASGANDERWHLRGWWEKGENSGYWYLDDYFDHTVMPKLQKMPSSLY